MALSENNMKPNQIHFISIGGSVMHNLALALHQKGDIVTGSDDEIYDPARTRLQNAGVLPQEMGLALKSIHIPNIFTKKASINIV